MAKRMGPEEMIHRQVADWLRAVKPDALWYHTPNGGGRSKAEAGILKALGTMPGVPDLTFIHDGGRASYIELKAPKKYATPEQKAFRDMVTALGCDWALCRSVDEVQVKLREWGLLRVNRA